MSKRQIATAITHTSTLKLDQFIYLFSSTLLLWLNDAFLQMIFRNECQSYKFILLFQIIYAITHINRTTGACIICIIQNQRSRRNVKFEPVYLDQPWQPASVDTE